MRHMVDVEVILDEAYADPKITIRAREKTPLVENIIESIENASETDFPMIPAHKGDNVEMLSQRDIVRVYTQGRRILVQTDDELYYVTKTLSAVEEMLNPDRFLRISQSEIMNIYKVKAFEFDKAGTIGIEFENGVKTWASRSRVKAIKEMLREGH
ncbi:MAG: LytTR family transcriptional regulator DNA-binding domain-containing protein [Lachnospiraceae bacterium]|nr:LytTR family transcriptional regulator DNA-binding domain-containing protein [Lachnospiraceae bacterium]